MIKGFSVTRSHRVAGPERYSTIPLAFKDGARLDQDARQVNTKFSKSFTTWFFPVGDEIRQIVVDWVDYLFEASLVAESRDRLPRMEF